MASIRLTVRGPSKNPSDWRSAIITEPKRTTQLRATPYDRYTMKIVAQNPAVDSLDGAARTRSEMRRRWLYILPAVFITYSLAYIDRTNYGFGAAAGLAQSLNISNSRSALLGALFFFGYFLFQVPGAAYARRRNGSTVSDGFAAVTAPPGAAALV